MQPTAFDTSAFPPELAARIAAHRDLFTGWRWMADPPEAGDGGSGGDGDAGGDGGQGAGPPDLTGLTADQLREHPEFQSEVNRILADRLAREKKTWQQKIDQEKETAGLEGEQRWAAEKQQLSTELGAKDGTISALQTSLARSRAESLAVQAGGKPERAAQIARLADLSNAIGADGLPDEAAIKAAVTAVLKDTPELKAGPAASAVTPGAPSGGELNGGTKEPTFTQSQVAAMTQDEVIANYDAIQKAMAEGRFAYDK